MKFPRIHILRPTMMASEVTQCGIYPEVNHVEVATHITAATCYLCRTRCGLPKSIRYNERSGGSAGFDPVSLPAFEVLSGIEKKEERWIPVTHKGFFSIPLYTVATEDQRLWLGSRLQRWCAGYHVVIVQNGRLGLFGLIRSKRPFPLGDPYPKKFEWELFTAPRKPRSIWERILADEGS